MKKIFELLLLVLLLAGLVFFGKDKLAAYYFNRGNDCYERHAYNEAIACFNKSLRINPSLVMAHYNLGNVYLDEKLEDKALKEYQKAVQLDDRFVWGYKAIVHLYIRRAMYRDARDILDEAAILVPGDPEIETLIKSVAFEQVTHLLSAGIDALSEGDRPKAQGLLEEALRINPNYGFARYALGYYYYIGKKYDEAESMLLEAVRLENQFYLAYKLLGDIYFEKHEFEKAIEVYTTALSICRSDSVLLNNVGLSFMNLEKYAEAVPFLEEALNLQADNVNMRYSLASVYRDSGRFDEAAGEYQKVISVHRDYPNVHNDLADVYKHLGRTDEAREEYRKEISCGEQKLLSRPDDPVALADSAYAYNAIGEYEKAKELIEKALTIKPDYREGYLTLASICRNVEDSAGAVAAFEKAKGLSAQKYLFIEEAMNDVEALRASIEHKTEFQPVDTLYLKNGRSLEGIIKEETKDDIILQIKVGASIGTVTVSRNNIERREQKGQ